MLSGVKASQGKKGKNVETYEGMQTESRKREYCHKKEKKPYPGLTGTKSGRKKNGAERARGANKKFREKGGGVKKEGALRKTTHNLYKLPMGGGILYKQKGKKGETKEEQ